MSTVHPQNEETYLNESQVAERLGLARITLQIWRGKGDGESPPYYKLGRRVVYRWSEVEAWVSARRKG